MKNLSKTVPECIWLKHLRIQWSSLNIILLGEAHWLKPPSLTRRHSNHLHELFYTGGPGKEHGTNKPPPTGSIRERSKGDTTCPTTSQNPPLWRPSWLKEAGTTRKDPESEWLAKDNPETNSFTRKPKTVTPVAEWFSWVPSPSCSPPRYPFPLKSLAFSAHVSPQTIHFRVLDKSPVWGPGRGSPSCNNFAILHHTRDSSHCSGSFPFILCQESEYFLNSRGGISFLIFSVMKEHVISK